MKRRDFVKGLAVTTAAAGTALAHASKTSASTETLDQAAAATQATAQTDARAQRARQMASFHTPNIPVSQPDVVAVTEQRYFTAARWATLVRFSDLVMPAGDGYPSATQAGAPEFLDFLIGASPADRQQMYNTGLDRLEADCHKKSGVSFAKSSAQQADGAIRPYLKGWINDHPPTEPHEHFIAMIHRDVRQATMNSPAWATAAEVAGERTPGVGLYVSPIDPGMGTWVNHGATRAASTTAPAAAKPAHS